MSNVFNLVSEETYIEQTDKIARFLAAIAAGNSGALKPTSWADVQAIVRAGLAGKVFAVGDQLTCQRDGVNLVWDIIGIDHDTPADPQFTHSLTLQLHDCFPTILQFDAPEAFYYAKNGLSAGTYYFSIDRTYDTTYNDLTSYQFTLTQDVPTGGQLFFDWTYNTQASAAKVTSYASATSKTALEQVAVSEGADGTNLRTLTAAGDFSHNLNSIHRVRYGNNNYKESAIRKWLNNSAAAGSAWTPQNDFDRPPTWKDTAAGFMNGMDADFLAVIGNVTKVTAKSGGGSDTTNDTFFLLSRSEIYGGAEVSGVNDGAAYPYYADYSDLTAAGTGADNNRIKYRNGSVQLCWIRTPLYGDGSSVRIVGNAGDIYNYYALYGFCVAPACCII